MQDEFQVLLKKTLHFVAFDVRTTHLVKVVSDALDAGRPQRKPLYDRLGEDDGVVRRRVGHEEYENVQDFFRSQSSLNTPYDFRQASRDLLQDLFLCLHLGCFARTTLLAIDKPFHCLASVNANAHKLSEGEVEGTP